MAKTSLPDKSTQGTCASIMSLVFSGSRAQIFNEQEKFVRKWQFLTG